MSSQLCDTKIPHDTDIAFTCADCNPKTASYWTSGTDLANESTFVWFSTGKPVASGFTDWHSGQPSDCTSTENCIDIYVNGGELSWYDSDCNQAYYFICEDTCCPPPSC